MNFRYTIHEIAELLGISTDAIRLYEKEGLVTPVRDPQNGYRYYDKSQIQRIMGIYLYRQLDVSLSEIRHLFCMSSFSDVSSSFSDFITDNEKKMEYLKNQTEKLRFMKQHIDNLNQGIGTYTIQELPKLYILYHQDSDSLRYFDMKDILTSPVFSYGNFCYTLKADTTHKYYSDSLQFLIREPMMELSPWHANAASLPQKESCQCLYTVARSPASDELHWNLDGLFAYADAHHYHYSSNAYAFYVFSLIPEDTVVDFYEIYLPITEDD